MRLIRDASELAAACAGGSALTIGMFDGVHLGHRVLLGETLRRAREQGLKAIALTFAQHPLSLLAPPYAPGLLSTPDEKAELLGSCGMDLCALLEFTPQFAAMMADEFLRQIVAQSCQARFVISGDDFRFGQGGQGHVDLLGLRGAELGYEAIVCPPVLQDGRPVRSTRVRQCLLEGRLAEAEALLGRPYRLEGIVAEGDRRGRTIGFPTANVEPPAWRLVPQNGVYAVRAHVRGAAYPAMLNIGTRPTFELAKRTIEAHLLDFDGDLYGETMVLEFVAWLRAEQRFSSVTGLITQLESDRAEARRRLS